MSGTRKILALLFISAGLFMLGRTVVVGPIDFYPNKVYVKESHEEQPHEDSFDTSLWTHHQNYGKKSVAQQAVNTVTAILFIVLPMVVGFILLLRNKRSGSR